MKYLVLSLLLAACLAKASDESQQPQQPPQPFMVHGVGYSFVEANEDAQAQAEATCGPLKAEQVSTIHQYIAPGHILYCADSRFACRE
jgi:hypothetical protein